MDSRGGPKIKCLTCGQTIQSKSRHDWVACGCKPDSGTRVFIDGGAAYTRIGAEKSSSYEDVVEEATGG